MKIDEKDDGWNWTWDKPSQFREAYDNAVSDNEREFFEKIMDKQLHEVSFSNDVLMHDRDNEDDIYILRIGQDDYMIGTARAVNNKPVPWEYESLFSFLSSDMYDYIGRHVTVHEWLRERDFKGIRYDANNDLR